MCIRRLQAGPAMALIDGGQNYEISKKIVSTLRDEMESPEFDKTPLRKILLNCHEQLGEMGERLGASLLLLKVSNKIEITSCGSIGAAVISNGTYKTLIESRSGLDEEEYERLRDADAFVNEDNLINGIAKYSRLIGHYSSYPAILPTPNNVTYDLDNDTDSLLIASSALFERVGNKQITQIISSTANPLIAAKRLQDVLQSYDYSSNSSITVVKFEKPSKIFKLENGDHENEMKIYNMSHWSRTDDTLEKNEIPALRTYGYRNSEEETLSSTRHIYEGIVSANEQQPQLRIISSRSMSPDNSLAPPDDPKTLSDEIQSMKSGPSNGTSGTDIITLASTSGSKSRESANKQDDTVVEVTTPPSTRIIRRANFALTPSAYSTTYTSFLTPTELSFSSKYRFEYARSQLSNDLRLQRPDM